MRLKLIIGLLIIGSSAFGQSMSVNWLKQSTFTAAGTNTYTVTATGVTQYVAGLELKIAFTNANTGASTLNVNALGARTLQKNGAALASGDIAAGGTYRITFDGTNFQVLGIGGGGGGGGGGGASWLLASGGTLTGNNTITMGANTVTFTGNRVSFTPNATTAGLNIGVVSADPSSLVNGDIWQESTNGRIGVRVSGISNYLLSTVGADAISNRIPFYASGVQARVSTTANFTYNGTTLLVGGTTPTASTTLDVRGPGTTSSTFGLRVANSSNTQLGVVQDNGALIFSMQGVDHQIGSTIINSSTARRTTFSSLGDGSGHAFLFTTTSATPGGNHNIFGITNNGWTPSTGTRTYALLSLTDVINSTGGTGHIVYGLNYAPTLTSMTGVTHIASRWTSGSHIIGGTALTNANTIFDIQSTTQGFTLPRMTDTQRNAITSPYSGLQIHSTTSNRPNWHNGTAWQEAASRSDLNGWLTGTLDNTTTTLNGATGDLVFDDFSSVTFSTVGSMTLGEVTTDVSIPGVVQLGGAGGSASMTSSDAAITVTTGTNALSINDGRVAPKGIEYAADYSANYTNRSLVDAGWANSRLRAKTLPAPGAGQNGQSIRWNNTTDQWEYFTAAGGATYYAPTSLVVHSSNADYTAVANSVLHLPDGILTTARTLTIPTGANGDVLEIYCNEDTHAWNLAGATVYLADRNTQVTQLLFNVPTLMQRIDGLWIIKN